MSNTEAIRTLAVNALAAYQAAHRPLSTPEQFAHIDALADAIQAAIEDYMSDLTHADAHARTHEPEDC